VIRNTGSAVVLATRLHVTALAAIEHLRVVMGLPNARSGRIFETDADGVPIEQIHAVTK
jgi:hypothetical protein